MPINIIQGNKMEFCIQASNPKTQDIVNSDDESLSDAIESAFLLNTENAILTWKYISIPLSYKYDISYMIDDLLKLLYSLQNMERGEMKIHWLPDTFRCDWSITWNHGRMEIESHWEYIAGHLEKLLINYPQLSVSVKYFVSEWKEILNIVLKGLKRCGYCENRIKGMWQLAAQFNSIENSGILYQK